MPAVAHATFLSLLGPRVPASFEQRRIFIGPGVQYPYEAREWRGAFLVVEFGRIELEWSGGRRFSFEVGDVLWLERLGLRAVHNPGPLPALVVAVRRRHIDQEQSQ